MPLQVGFEIINNPTIQVEKIINFSFDQKLIEEKIIHDFKGSYSHPLLFVNTPRDEFSWSAHQCLLIDESWYLKIDVSFKGIAHNDLVKFEKLNAEADNISIEMLVRQVDIALCGAFFDMFGDFSPEHASNLLDYDREPF